MLLDSGEEGCMLLHCWCLPNDTAQHARRLQLYIMFMNNIYLREVTGCKGNCGGTDWTRQRIICLMHVLWKV